MSRHRGDTGSDLYGVLGIARTASEDEIRRAYRRQALRWHPDKNPDDRESAEVMFKKVAEAYEVLSNPAARRRYDATGQVSADDSTPSSGTTGGFGQRFHPAGGASMFDAFGGGGSFRGSGGAGFAFHDPFEIFRSMFADLGRDDDFFGPAAFGGIRDPFFSSFFESRQQPGTAPRHNSASSLHDPFRGSHSLFGDLGMMGRFSTFSSSSMSSSTFGRGGGGGSTQMSSTTSIENGRKVTRTVKRVIGPDGTVHEDVDEKVELLPSASASQAGARYLPPQAVERSSAPPALSFHQQQEARGTGGSFGERRFNSTPTRPQYQYQF